MHEDEDIVLNYRQLKKAVQIFKDKLSTKDERRSMRRYLMYLTDEQMADPDLALISRIATNFSEDGFTLWLHGHFGFEELMLEGGGEE